MKQVRIICDDDMGRLQERVNAFLEKLWTAYAMGREIDLIMSESSPQTTVMICYNVDKRG